MEVYLVKDHVADLDYVEKQKDDYVEKCWESFPVLLEPVAEDSREACEAMKKLLIETSPTKAERVANDGSPQYSMIVSLFVPTLASEYGKIEFTQDGDDVYVIETLISTFKKENLSFSLTIKALDVKYSCGCSELAYLEFKDVKISAWGYDPLFDNIKLPEHGLHPEATLDGERISDCCFTLTVKLNEKALVKLKLTSDSEGLPWHPAAAKLKMLLDEAVGSDMVMVAANGEEVKCHKSILMVSCDAFRAMFEHKMKEEATNRLEMIDMSEAGVRAFLKFIYYCEATAAGENCDIALELFRAGDKYRISSLQADMKTLICSKGVEWFNVDMAVRLSLHSQNYEEKEEILKKVAEVLKWYSKNKSAELLASEEYQELFQDNPKVAMKLVSLFLEFA